MKDKIQLSKRMKEVADMVTRGNRVVDCGCDHGFVSIYLALSNIASGVIATDLREGPLENARKHICEYGLDEKIETRISDGITKIQSGEADTLVIAGMGGPLMASILFNDCDKTNSFKELILQPQSEIKEFRTALREHGIMICEERAIFEDGKYYFAMKAIPCAEKRDGFDFSGGSKNSVEADLFDSFGEYLLKEKNEVLQKYLCMRKEKLMRIVSGVTDKTSDNLSKLNDEINLIEKAQAYMGICE